MELTKTIQEVSPVPIPHHVMLGLLHDYKDPNDKIRQLIAKGILERVTNGLYIAGPRLGVERPHPFLLANQILGPSYVSMESALSYHGLIPERVYTTTSMTIKTAREYRTASGNFTYTRIPLPYYAYGIQSVRLSSAQTVMLASPAKALLDKIITTAGVQFRSPANVVSYLESDLRADVDKLKELDWSAVQTWLADAPKKRTLSLLLETLPNL